MRRLSRSDHQGDIKRQDSTASTASAGSGLHARPRTVSLKTPGIARLSSSLGVVEPNKEEQQMRERLLNVNIALVLLGFVVVLTWYYFSRGYWLVVLACVTMLLCECAPLCICVRSYQQRTYHACWLATHAASNGSQFSVRLSVQCAASGSADHYVRSASTLTMYVPYRA